MIENENTSDVLRGHRSDLKFYEDSPGISKEELDEILKSFKIDDNINKELIDKLNKIPN